VLELYSCAASGGKFIVAMTPSERDRFAQEILVDPGAFFRMLSKISTKNAQCSRMEDRVSSHVLFTTVVRCSGDDVYCCGGFCGFGFGGNDLCESTAAADNSHDDDDDDDDDDADDDDDDADDDVC
jgi:hypothetical protein